MGIYRPKLEPGERLIWRHPLTLTRREWAVRVAVALCVGGFSYAIHSWSIHADTAALAPYWALIWSLYALAVGTSRQAWHIAVTDRRLLVQSFPPWRAPRKIPLDEIESISMDVASYRILVGGGGKEIWINPDLVGLPDLKQALGFAEVATR